MQNWDFIDSPPQSGQVNMDTDARLFSDYLEGKIGPTFRIYQWDAPTVSLGRFQQAEETLFFDKCAEDNVKYVQRMTGGGAIYHSPDEITYSLVCHDSLIGDKLPVKITYKILCGFIIEFYRRLGLDAAFAVDVVNAEQETLGMKSMLCFAAKEEYDIVINGYKIGGNAQRRSKHFIFQHGSIPIKFDGLPLQKYIKGVPDDIDSRATSLTGLGISQNVSALRRILKESFFDTIASR